MTCIETMDKDIRILYCIAGEHSNSVMIRTTANDRTYKRPAFDTPVGAAFKFRGRLQHLGFTIAEGFTTEDRW